VLFLMFQAVFTWAEVPKDAIDNGFQALGGFIAGHLPPGLIRGFLTDGLISGVGSVLVFLPQILVLFLFIILLEDFGYMARAAFLMDRIMGGAGLHGRAFIPLLSSFACAIPGIMATRTIENRKDRLATIFIAPFMSCSARLPVYTLLIGTFFVAWGAIAQAGIMLSLYALGIVAAAATAWLFKRSMLKGPKAAFILELPTYKVPQASQIARTVWVNTREFLTKAGTTIFCLSVVLWALMYYPRLPGSQRDEITGRYTAVANAWGNESHLAAKKDSSEFAKVQERYFDMAAHDPRGEPEAHKAWDSTCAAESDAQIASAQLRHSFAGRFGHVIEPVIRPLGYDWKMGVGLVGAFAAREVFVSTMAITYSAGDKEHTADLAGAMKADRYPDGRPVWTPLAAVSLLIWFVLAMQCLSTLSVVRKETGGWGWPIAMLIYMNALAYVVCLGVYQIGLRMR
jgi:ferrous iron transport protein B